MSNLYFPSFRFVNRSIVLSRREWGFRFRGEGVDHDGAAARAAVRGGDVGRHERQPPRFGFPNILLVVQIGY